MLARDEADAMAINRLRRAAPYGERAILARAITAYIDGTDREATRIAAARMARRAVSGLPEAARWLLDPDPARRDEGVAEAEVLDSRWREGVGSVPAVCFKKGRNCVGVEKDPEYLRRACQRQAEQK
jgi:hypothetical protein